ncbi:MAG: hypothetical protein KJO07_22570 [Deltaproteobacteria bacterium]|jgi:hypothetical protein|nr:hypothetical protein [Deltaproteobacteria bacterium]
MRAVRTVPLVVGIAGLVALVSLAVAVRSLRESANGHHREARASQDRQLGRALPRSPRAEQPEPKPLASKVCVRGVDGFAMAATRSLAVRLDLRDPSSEQALALISTTAVRAQRFVEQLAPAPTLPKRMGSTTEGPGGQRIPRQPVNPRRRACDGTAYAWFALDSRSPLTGSAASRPDAPTKTD